MQTHRFQLFLPAAGVIFALLLIAGLAIGGEPPSETATPEKVMSYWTDNHDASMARALIAPLMAALFVFFGAAVRSALRSGEAEEASYSAVAFGGTILAAGGFALDGVLAAATASSADEGQSAATYTLNQLFVADYVPVAAGLAVMLIAAGFGGLRTLALPTWLAVAAAVIGLAFLTPLGFFGYLLLPLWTIATSVVLYRRRSEPGVAGYGSISPRRMA